MPVRSTTMGKHTKARKTAKRALKADTRATHIAARHHQSAPARVADFVAQLADQPQLYLVSGATLAIGLATGRRDLVRGGGRMLVAHTLATAGKALVKRAVDRTRPVRAMAVGHTIGKGEQQDWEHNSMPSGHTASAVAVSRAITHEVQGTAAPAAMATGAVAAVQPVAGNHYVSDVLVGAAIGWAAEAATGWLFDRWAPADTADD